MKIPNIKFKPLLFSLFVLGLAIWWYCSNQEMVSKLLPDFLSSLDLMGDSKQTGFWTLIIGALSGGGGYSWFRRVKTSGRVELSDYFTKPEFTSFPTGRMGYSDRLAYTLAELADLAYWDVFTDQELESLELIVESRIADGRSDIANVAKTLLYSRKQTTKDVFEEVLARGGFKSINHSIRTDNIQCFACVHEGFDRDVNHQPYAVIAFRGSETDIDDWLTNGDAVPAAEFKPYGSVHQGFYKGYKGVQRQVLDSIEKVKIDYGEDIPIFFTGHSLGGAIAVVATRLNAANLKGACYTYGCPRVGDYSFFKGVKTPVFRVVNSSDLVPRVPPDFWSHIVILLLTACAFLTARYKPLSDFFDAAKGWVDKINDYRHYGDMRFLPDIPSAGIDDSSRQIRELQVLPNPNHFDVIQWFFRHLGTGLGMPVQSHSMKLYRNKLLRVATNRMEHFDINETQI